MRLFIWSDEVSKGPRVAPTAGSATSPPLAPSRSTVPRVMLGH